MKETSDKRERLPSLKSIPISILKKHTQSVNEYVYSNGQSCDLILLIYCGAKVVGELCGVVPKPSPVFQMPKIRLDRKLKRLEHNPSQLWEMQQGQLLSQGKYQRLDRAYKLNRIHLYLLFVSS